MADADIALCSVQARGTHGGTLPVIDSAQVDHDLVTLSGSSQMSDFSVPAGSVGLLWQITAIGGALRVKFGANPTAVAGDKAAVIAA